MEFGSISLKLSTGAVFVTDIVSLSIMLIGLLRMRRETAGAFSLGTLGQFFWKQVRWFQLPLTVILPYLLMRVSIHQGLIWILIATVSEVPTVVCLAVLLDCFFLLIASQAIMILDLNGSFSFPRIH